MMNRPKSEDFKTICTTIGDNEIVIGNYKTYSRELEKYCDELEKREKPMIVHKKSPMEELRLGNAWFCPVCNNWLTRGIANNYCSSCGQRVECADE